MRFNAKEIFQNMRGVITRKTLVIAGVPLLLFAVAVALLSFFALNLADTVSDSRASLMLDTARQAFPDAEIAEASGLDSYPGCTLFTARAGGQVAGYCAAAPVYGGLGRQSFALVAVDTSGTVLCEKAFAPEGADLAYAFETAREAALALSRLASHGN